LRYNATKNFQVLFDVGMNDIIDIFKMKAGNKRVSVFDKYKNRNRNENGHMIIENKDNELNHIGIEIVDLKETEPICSNGYLQSKMRPTEDEEILKKSAFTESNLNMKMKKPGDEFINKSF
jgi:hypothetical protein